MMDKPAFPASLPPKQPTLPPGARPTNAFASANSVRPASAPPSSGSTKIILAFLGILTLANLALTIYFNQPKDNPGDAALAATAQAQQQQILKLTEELASLRAKLGVTINDFNRLKSDHMGLSSRVSSIQLPPKPLPYDAKVQEELVKPATIGDVPK